MALIALSTGDTILQSRNYGLLRSPDFDANKSYFVLTGIQGKTGKHYVTEEELYTLSVGDKFEEWYEGSSNGSAWPYVYGIDKRVTQYQITSKKEGVNQQGIKQMTYTYSGKQYFRKIAWHYQNRNDSVLEIDAIRA